MGPLQRVCTCKAILTFKPPLGLAQEIGQLEHQHIDKIGRMKVYRCAIMGQPAAEVTGMLVEIIHGQTEQLGQCV
jgi:hypothetical protein